jgi:Flp pilus assembly protein TadD
MMTTATANRTRMLGLALTTALASATLAGCAGKAAPSAAVSADAARAALAKGKGDKAVTAAEAAVLASPRDAQARTLLGAAYVEAGRFVAAEAAFADAMALGDGSGRTVLIRSLALSATGRYAEAQALLAEHQKAIDPVDYGLAITLAGSPQQGIEMLSSALRYGENSPKLRQNLAYAFALDGNWRSARLLAAQDVPADKLDERLGEWAQMSMPQMAAHRVAALLGVTAKEDAGQPVHLALTNFPTNEQLAAEAATQQAAPVGETAPAPAVALASQSAELPAAGAIASPAEPVVIARFEAEETLAPAPVATSSMPAAPRIKLPEAKPSAAKPVRVAAAKPAPAKPAPAAKAAFVREPGDYRVQLGSYLSQADADAAWARFQKRPELKGAERVVTTASVNGRTYYRVAAGGFAKSSANSFCAMVKQAGGGCLAYSAGRTLQGSAPAAARAAAKPAVKARVAVKAARGGHTRVAAR